MSPLLALMPLASVAMNLGDSTDNPEAGYRTDIASDPKDALAHYNLGTVLMSSGDVVGAELEGGLGVVDLSDATGTITKKMIDLPKPIGKTEAFSLSVSVLDKGSTLLIEIEGREPIEHELSPPLGGTNHAGVFVEWGKMKITEAEIEFL